MGFIKAIVTTAQQASGARSLNSLTGWHRASVVGNVLRGRATAIGNIFKKYDGVPLGERPVKGAARVVDAGYLGRWFNDNSDRAKFVFKCNQVGRLIVKTVFADDGLDDLFAKDTFAYVAHRSSRVAIIFSHKGGKKVQEHLVEAGNRLGSLLYKFYGVTPEVAERALKSPEGAEVLKCIGTGQDFKAKLGVLENGLKEGLY